MSTRTELPKPATTSADGSATTSTDVHMPLTGGALRWNEPANSATYRVRSGSSVRKRRHRAAVEIAYPTPDRSRRPGR